MGSPSRPSALTGVDHSRQPAASGTVLKLTVRLVVLFGRTVARQKKAAGSQSRSYPGKGLVVRPTAEAPSVFRILTASRCAPQSALRVPFELMDA